jgi:hypothetical protein
MNSKKLQKLFNKDIKRGINKTVNQIEKTTNQTVNQVEKTANQTANQIEQTAIQTGDVLKDTFRFNRRFDFPPILSEYLDKYGDNIIVGATIYRHKVNGVITSALNLLSNNNYDRLFHLRVYFTLDNGKEIYIEKNERLNAGSGNKQAGHHFLVVDPNDIPQGLTFRQLIENTQLRMGEKFLTYSASSNNCQYFIRAVFQANNMLRPNYEAFIKQDTEAIFKNNPLLRKFSNTVTDVAGEANAIMSGGNISEHLYCVCCDKLVPMQEREKHNTLQSHKKKKQQLIKDGSGMMKY